MQATPAAERLLGACVLERLPVCDLLFLSTKSALTPAADTK